MDDTSDKFDCFLFIHLGKNIYPLIPKISASGDHMLDSLFRGSSESTT